MTAADRHGQRLPAPLRPRARHVYLVRWVTTAGTTKTRVFLLRASAETFLDRVKPWRDAALFTSTVDWQDQQPRADLDRDTNPTTEETS